MLSEKPWRADAIMRLFVSVLICFFMGQLLMTLIEHIHHPNAQTQWTYFTVFAAAAGLYAGGIWVLARPWPLERLPLKFALLLVCVYGGIFLTMLAAGFVVKSDPNLPTTPKALVGILSFQGAALVFVHRFIREHQTTWTQAFGLRNNIPRALVFGVAAAAFVIPATMFIGGGISWLLERFSFQPQEQLAVQIVRTAETPLEQLALAVATIVIAPIAEEILFRGILYPAIKRAGFPRLAFWGSAAIFAGIHLDAIRFLPLMVLALVLTWVFEETDNLLASISAHSIFNATTFVILLKLPQG